MAQQRKCDSTVVNELLAFVQNKLDVMDELSLEQICSTSYTEAEIHAAKVVLLDTAKTPVRASARKKDGNGKKDLRDIFRVFKETEPDDVPTYVAKDLNKLPPVTFDHVDVTTLLKHIQLLRADITDIRGKLEASERISDELRRELTSLRNADIAPANTRPSVGMQNDTPPRLSKTPSTARATDTDVPRDIAPAPADARRTSAPPAPAPAPPAPTPAAGTKTSCPLGV